jgi:hypothetical protein
MGDNLMPNGLRRVAKRGAHPWPGHYGSARAFAVNPRAPKARSVAGFGGLTAQRGQASRLSCQEGREAPLRDAGSEQPSRANGVVEGQTPPKRINSEQAPRRNLVYAVNPSGRQRLWQAVIVSARASRERSSEARQFSKCHRPRAGTHNVSDPADPGMTAGVAAGTAGARARSRRGQRASPSRGDARVSIVGHGRAALGLAPGCHVASVCVSSAIGCGPSRFVEEVIAVE